MVILLLFVAIEDSLLLHYFSFVFAFLSRGVGVIYSLCTHRSCIVVFDTRTGGHITPAMSRRRPNFAARTAEADDSRLDPNEPDSSASAGFLPLQPAISPPQQGLNPTASEHHHHSWSANPFHDLSRVWGGRKDNGKGQETSGQSASAHMPPSAGPLRDASADRKDRSGHRPRPTEESKKLGTFSGVFVPVTLNVLSILMFLRFGFVLGQGGLLGILGKLPSQSCCCDRS